MTIKDECEIITRESTYGAGVDFLIVGDALQLPPVRTEGKLFYWHLANCMSINSRLGAQVSVGAPEMNRFLLANYKKADFVLTNIIDFFGVLAATIRGVQPRIHPAIDKMPAVFLFERSSPTAGHPVPWGLLDVADH